jgi:hypothetical protein
MKYLAFLCVLILALPALAQEEQEDTSLTFKDSITYTMDDGVMSPKEMEAEARHIYRLCDANPYQKTYFDCACLGGAFLQQREKLGPMTPQFEIFESLTKRKGSRCANAPAVAGETYEFCINHRLTYYELSTDRENESYCSCVANKMARDFTKEPVLDMVYIDAVKINAMTYCDDPRNRSPQTAANLNQ